MDAISLDLVRSMHPERIAVVQPPPEPGRRQHRKATRQVRQAIALQRLGGWVGGSIGQAEALAGVNVQSHQERTVLWTRFRHLFAGDSQTLVDAVADHCATITLHRIRQGELCLLPQRY